ncbi:MAG: ribonuclease T [Gammaproteobacteria bacterium]|nr:ribonuclease T [Gammaproteobacteria bacterium]
MGCNAKNLYNPALKFNPKQQLVQKSVAAQRFRGFLPVVIDVETGGFNAQTDALLEIAGVLLEWDDTQGWHREQTVAHHVKPFEGARLEEAALKFNKIDPHHPFRLAVTEKDALADLFSRVREAVQRHGCTRAILVGHNPAFDLSFVKAAVERSRVKRNPFHSFSTFDTASLAGVAFGQTVLSRAVVAANLDWQEEEAHSAIYDAEKTADLFCAIVNQWDRLRESSPASG